MEMEKINFYLKLVKIREFEENFEIKIVLLRFLKVII